MTTIIPLRRVWLLPGLVLLIWLLLSAVLVVRPVATLASTQGLFPREGSERPYYWSGSRISVPLATYSGPTRLSLTLGMFVWPGHEFADVQVLFGQRPVAQLRVTPQTRTYTVLVPPDATTLTVQTPVSRPPGGEWRWLGVQVFGLDAAASGLPLRAIGTALLLALLSIPIILASSWIVRRGHGPIALITLVALAVRLWMLDQAPPGAHRDEVVSTVDAWNLLHTGRDHLGHLLPLAAFEAYGDWISPLLTYVQLPAVALLGPQALAARLTTALLGALVAPALYALARELRLPVVAGLAAALVAALSPWQTYLSRVAIPPALVPLAWTLCVWAALRFVAFGARRDAVFLALAAGLGLYAYPTMKLAVPLLTAAAILLRGVAMRHQDRRPGLRAWWSAAVLLALLWAPFAASLLFNPDSNARLGQIGIQADSPLDLADAIWRNYSVYLQPDFYYLRGDWRKAIRAVPGHGAELWATAPLVLLGIGLLAWRMLRPAHERRIWWLLVLALLIAPLPASLTTSNPHSFRAATIAPLYALLAGLGVALLWMGIHAAAQRLRAHARAPRMAAGILAVLIMPGMLWQYAGWYRDLLQQHARITAITWFFADQLPQTMQRVVALAPAYDEVWIDSDSVGRPYVYLLAAQPMPPAESQALTRVLRRPGEPHFVEQIGRYHFGDLSAWPIDLPTVESIPDRFGVAGYIMQEREVDGKRLLVLRGMESAPLERDTEEP